MKSKKSYLFLSFLSWKKRCGYVAAGGQRSQLLVGHLTSPWTNQISVGGSINNALCISRHAPTNTTRLLICNNDETIKIYELPTLQRIASITLPTAVNYCAISPDGRRMVAVGDSNQVFLFDVSPSGTYTKVDTLIGKWKEK